MTNQRSLLFVVRPVIDILPHDELRETLIRSFTAEEDAVQTIEQCFNLIPNREWSQEFRRNFASSWKATHLKMLAIYGLSCRLQRMASAPDASHVMALHTAAAKNAETSYEDLGLDFDAQTHADLYDNFAEALVGDDQWVLPKYRLPEAHAFSRWVYRNMVVGDIADGLLTNMFSEIYNHGEYSIAQPAFSSYFAEHTNLSPERQEQALTYIGAHVQSDVEADHFLVVVSSLEHYLSAAGKTFDAAAAEHVFRTYLKKLAPVMAALTVRMQQEMPAHHAAVAGMTLA